MNRARVLGLGVLIATATASRAAAQTARGPRPACEVLARVECAAPTPVGVRPVPGRAVSQDRIPELPDRWIGPDKLRHFFLSFGTTGFARAGAEAVGAGDAARWIGPAVAGLAGIGKELSDRSRGWGFSLRDLAWDVAGIAMAVLVLRGAG
ncbi:MAG: hypothetical protein PVH00_01080 [Gemmatimonadota bacterium]